jgi:hypothetical protein
MTNTSPAELAAQVAELTEALRLHQEALADSAKVKHELGLAKTSIEVYRAMIAALNENLTVAKHTEDALRAEIASLRGATI